MITGGSVSLTHNFPKKWSFVIRPKSNRSTSDVNNDNTESSIVFWYSLKQAVLIPLVWASIKHKSAKVIDLPEPRPPIAILNRFFFSRKGNNLEGICILGIFDYFYLPYSIYAYITASLPGKLGWLKVG